MSFLNIKMSKRLESFVENNIDKELPKYKATFEILRRDYPDIRNLSKGDKIITTSDFKNEIPKIISNLNNSYIVIQGPPGTGKTYSAADTIIELINQDKTIGVTSNSHKAIHNLLESMEKIAHEKNIQVHYLGYYIPWHPQGAYYYAVENGGFQASPERTPGTYSKYNSIDDKIDDFHYYATYIKFGIGRATYDAAQEIRNGEIDRTEGVALVKKYDGEFPVRFSKEIFEYLSIPKDEYPVASSQFDQHVMDRDYFFHVADSFRSPHLWFQDATGWKLRHTVWR